MMKVRMERRRNASASLANNCWWERSAHGRRAPVFRFRLSGVCCECVSSECARVARGSREMKEKMTGSHSALTNTGKWRCNNAKQMSTYPVYVYILCLFWFSELVFNSVRPGTIQKGCVGFRSFQKFVLIFYILNCNRTAARCLFTKVLTARLVQKLTTHLNHEQHTCTRFQIPLLHIVFIVVKNRCQYICKVAHTLYKHININNIMQ